MFHMDRPRVDYNQLAPTYHSRYDGPNKLDGIAQALRSFDARCALEVGCGTGRFLVPLRETGEQVFGVDASTGMLSQAAARLGPSNLVAARANQLPFAPELRTNSPSRPSHSISFAASMQFTTSMIRGSSFSMRLPC